MGIEGRNKVKTLDTGAAALSEREGAPAGSWLARPFARKFSQPLRFSSSMEIQLQYGNPASLHRLPA